MMNTLTTILGKLVQRIARLRGGGSALPGLVVEKLNPNYTASILSKLPYGTVVISGTNGKTTTTKIVVELLQSQGMKVFTNKTGSNFSRGVAASLIDEVSISGKLNADIAVLELDEAHAVHFVKSIPPTYSLLLNVMRDQLDRFGEIDATAKLLHAIAKATTGTIVLNREDERIRLAESVVEEGVDVKFFGLSSSTRSMFPNDEEIRALSTKAANDKPALVELSQLEGSKAVFKINDNSYTTELKLRGIYNVFNAAAALSLVLAIKGTETDINKLIATLSEIRPAFGRGETIKIEDKEIDLVLVKNPGGLSLALKSFPPEGYETAFAINDNYSDGRDMSWLWDVSFEPLKDTGVSYVTGSRAYDMALRLKYDEVSINKTSTSIENALREIISSNKSNKKRIYCTYTAMLDIRKRLSKITKVEEVL